MKTFLYLFNLNHYYLFAYNYYAKKFMAEVFIIYEL